MTKSKNPKTKAKPKRKYRKYNKSMYSKAITVPLGNSYLFRTRYFHKGLTITSGATGACGTHVFSANGLFKSDITSTTGTHQCLAFDELMLMYDHYTVVGSRIRVLLHNKSNTAKLVCGIYVADELAAETDARRIIENGRGKWGYLLEEGSNSKSAREFTLGFSTKKFFGIKDVIDRDSLKGDYSNNPSEQAYYHIWVADLATGGATDVDCTVELEYSAVLTEPQRLSLS